MFPETEFHKNGKFLGYVILDGRVYCSDNSRDVNSNFIFLNGVKYPLVKHGALRDMDKLYFKKNKTKLEQIKRSVIQQMNREKFGAEIKIKQDALFFLTEIYPKCDRDLDPDISRVKIEKGEEPKTKGVADQSPLLEKILDTNCLILATRVFPLKASNESFHLNLNGQNFVYVQSRRTVDDVETEFYKRLEDRLKQEALAESQDSSRYKQQLMELDAKINYLLSKIGGRKYTHCYECEDIGYDFGSGLIYWLLPGENSDVKYNSQKGVGLFFGDGILGDSANVVTRPNRSFPFSAQHRCYGTASRMNRTTLQEKIYYLKTCRDKDAVTERSIEHARI